MRRDPARVRAAAVAAALATALAAGWLGSLFMSVAPRTPAVSVQAQTTVTRSVTAPLGSVISGRVFDVQPAALVLRTILGRIVVVATSAATRYDVHPSAKAIARDSILVGAFVDVQGTPLGLDGFSATTVTLLPHFLGDRPGFVDRRSPSG